MALQDVTDLGLRYTIAEIVGGIRDKLPRLPSSGNEWTYHKLGLSDCKTPKDEEIAMIASNVLKESG